ncbi:MAG: ParA family protein [Planctomycetota bacterium]|jgi:chromosome partitioning protein
MRTYTVSNQKGGVAKTTTVISLAGALAGLGYRVLLCDMDPQANLTMGFGIEPEEVSRGMFHVLTGESPIQGAIQPNVFPGVDLIPADLTLAGAEKRLFGEIGFDEILRGRLDALRAQGPVYDVVLIDSPPSLGLLTINAITAASTVIVPVQCEYFSARGLAQLLEITETVRARRNPNLAVRVLPTLLDKRNRVCCEIADELREGFAGEVFETAIGIDTRVRESQAAGLPVTAYAPKSRAAVQYRALAAEIAKRDLPPRALPAVAAKKKAKSSRARKRPADDSRRARAHTAHRSRS